MVERKEFRNRTHAIISFIRLGMKINMFRMDCKDPKFVESLKQSWNENEILYWAEKVSPQDRETIAMALALEREKDIRKILKQIKMT